MPEVYDELVGLNQYAKQTSPYNPSKYSVFNEELIWTSINQTLKYYLRQFRIYINKY
jgi:hypothetical protein